MVPNWETTGQMPSEEQGVADAKAAQAEAAGLGLGGAVIYFSADFDPTGETTAINAYMRGVASVIGKERTGLYGGYAAIQAYFDADIGAYGWQTYAWSSGEWDMRAKLQQWNNDYKMGPTTVDQDRATAVDYGQNPRPGSVVGWLVAVQDKNNQLWLRNSAGGNNQTGLAMAPGAPGLSSA